MNVSLGEMKIVKFKDGTYGVRKWFVIYFYKHFTTGFWCSINSKFFGGCRGSLAEAELLTDKGEIVK